MIKNDIEQKKTYYRSLRETECFPVINRGKLWYDCLTTEQVSQLSDWYWKWLGITETFEIPEKPTFLNNKLSKEEILL